MIGKAEQQVPQQFSARGPVQIKFRGATVAEHAGYPQRRFDDGSLASDLRCGGVVVELGVDQLPEALRYPVPTGRRPGWRRSCKSSVALTAGL